MTITAITQQTISTETALAELLLAILTKQDKLQQKLEILQAENKDLRKRLDTLENEKTGLLGKLARQEEQSQGQRSAIKLESLLGATSPKIRRTCGSGSCDCKA